MQSSIKIVLKLEEWQNFKTMQLNAILLKN
jgi:hypothetical protein